MAKKNDITVETKLRRLYDLQLIDSRIDQIKNMRGELPNEIKNLEDKILRMQASINASQEELKNVEQNIKEHKNIIENAQLFIKKYTEQQKGVRNNREYNSITKEIEYQELEIQLAEKNINKYKLLIEEKEEVIVREKETLAKQQEVLKIKKTDLDVILLDTKKEEEELLKKSKEYRKIIEENLMKAYDRLRSNFSNGLAIVPIDRGASGGTYIMVPPQIQAEVAMRQRIITDEYSSRILVDSELAAEETEKMKKIIKSYEQ